MGVGGEWYTAHVPEVCCNQPKVLSCTRQVYIGVLVY